MLTKSSIDAAYPIAQELADRNIALGAIENTPLSMLVDHSLENVISFSMMNQQADGVAPPSFIDLLMAGANNPNEMDQNHHDDMMSEAVGVVERGMHYLIATSREVVNPKIGEIVTAVDAAMAAHRKVSENPISVRSVYDPFIWKSEAVLDLVNRYIETREENVAYTGPAIPYSFDLLKTGLHSIDSDLSFFVSNEMSDTHSATLDGEVTKESKVNKIDEIWAKTFGSGGFKTTDVLRGTRDATNTALIVFFASMSMKNNPPEGTDMSMTEWATMCNTLQTEAGRVVATNLKRLATARRLKNLGIVWPSSHMPGSEIAVDGDVYSGFCQLGGSPEVLIGAYFHDKNTDFDQLLVDADKYRGIYTRTQGVLSGKAKADGLSVFINSINAGVTDVINNGLGDVKLPNNDKAALHEKLKGQLGLITHADIDCCWSTVRRVLCRSVFEGVGIEQFLQDIDHHRAEHHSFTVREAALMATFDALGRWIAQLINVTAIRS